MSKHTIKNSLSASYHRYFKRGFSGITASTRVLPNFIIIGTVRSGSTSLYYNICEHPSVMPAAYDEIGFFDSNFHLGINWYRSMFPTQKNMDELQKNTPYDITGEDTPFYFWKNEVVERISRTIPNSKFIIIFRNPVDRAYSNYNLAVRTGNEELSFEDSIDEEIEFMKNHTFRESVDRHRSYLSKGLYAKQLDLWKKMFSMNQIHILSTENMKNEPQLELLKIFEFLQISKYQIKNPQKQKMYNYEKMSLKMKQKLSNYYKPYNEKLFDMIGKRFEWND